MARTKAAARPAQTPPPQLPTAPSRNIAALDAIDRFDVPVAALAGIEQLAEVTRISSEQDLAQLNRKNLAALLAVVGESFQARMAHAHQIIEGGSTC